MMKLSMAWFGRARIPDPTTSGDLTRRFDQDSLLTLMEAINADAAAGLGETA